MKKSNQIEIKIRDISFIPDWNTLLSMPLSVKEKLDPVSCTFFYTNRQGLQASIASKAMQRYSPMYYSICETRQWFYFVYKCSLHIKESDHILSLFLQMITIFSAENPWEIHCSRTEGALPTLT